MLFWLNKPYFLSSWFFVVFFFPHQRCQLAAGSYEQIHKGEFEMKCSNSQQKLASSLRNSQFIVEIMNLLLCLLTSSWQISRALTSRKLQSVVSWYFSFVCALEFLSFYLLLEVFTWSRTRQFLVLWQFFFWTAIQEPAVLFHCLHANLAVTQQRDLSFCFRKFRSNFLSPPFLPCQFLINVLNVGDECWILRIPPWGTVVDGTKCISCQCDTFLILENSVACGKSCCCHRGWAFLICGGIAQLSAGCSLV